MIDEGYIKYRSDWIPGPAPDKHATDLLNRWRKPLFDAGLIGHYEQQGVGYGNISVRMVNDQFVISGTQTGHIEITSAEHYALVTAADIGSNRVTCHGPVQASSEAMTHASLYALCTQINAVVHVHNLSLWERYKDRLPTTRTDVAYGTPDMAREFESLWRDTDFRDQGMAVMAGHAEGLVSIGDSLDQAAERILHLYRSI